MSRGPSTDFANLYPPTPPHSILGFEAEMDETNPFGDVTISRITLRTMITTGKVTSGQAEWNYDFGFIHDTDRSSLTIQDRNCSEKWKGLAVLDDDGNHGQEVFLVLLSDWEQVQKLWTVLLLQKVLDKEQTYRRVGLGLIGQTYLSWDGSYNTQEFRGNWERKDIVIV